MRARLRSLWTAIRVDVAVLMAILAVLLAYPEQWGAFLCDMVGIR